MLAGRQATDERTQSNVRRRRVFEGADMPAAMSFLKRRRHRQGNDEKREGRRTRYIGDVVDRVCREVVGERTVHERGRRDECGREDQSAKEGEARQKFLRRSMPEYSEATSFW